MKIHHHNSLFWLVLITVFFSCAAGPRVKETPPGTQSPGGAENVSGLRGSSPVQETPPSTVLENPAEPENLSHSQLPETPGTLPVEERKAPIRFKPAVPEYIMGRGVIPPDDMSAFLLGANPGAGKEFVEKLAAIYLEEASIEGVNHDTAFAQMCLETGFLRFGGLVTADMNNFCGLGATGPGNSGASFPDPRTGVRAHIQHLKAYATEAPLKQDLVDPRYRLVRFGSSPAIKGLSGTWAADQSYADKIKNILERLYNFVYEI